MSEEIWIDPLKQKNEEEFRRNWRDINERSKENIRKRQENCPHLQGCNVLNLSGICSPSGLTCIVWHELNDLRTVGICLNCSKKFFPEDADYAVWRLKKSGNRISRAGKEVKLSAEEQEQIRTEGYGNLPNDFGVYEPRFPTLKEFMYAEVKKQVDEFFGERGQWS